MLCPTESENYVEGTTYIRETYDYHFRWRNYGIILAFLIGLCALYLTASEFISEAKSKGELKLYPRTRVPKKHDDEKDDIEGAAGASNRHASDESENVDASIPEQTAIFHFEDLCYDIPVKVGSPSN